MAGEMATKWLIMMDKDSAFSTFTVATTYVKGLLAAFEVMNLKVEALLAYAKITPAQLAVPDNRIELSRLKLLWQSAIEMNGATINGADIIGLEVGQQMPAGHWGLLEMLASNSETLGEVFESALDYWRLISDTGKQFRITPSDEVVTFSFKSPFFNLPQANEADMVYLERRIKLLLGSDVNPINYQFSHSKHGDLTDDDYKKYFSAPILFDGDSNSVTLPAEVFSRRIVSSNSELKKIVVDMLSQQLKSLNNTVTTAQQVTVIAQTGVYSLEKVASTLHLGSRTLQRRLGEEDTNFNTLISEVKKSKAEKFLTSREYSVQEISFLLGYQHERAFYEAFQRWFGTSPSGFIASLKG